MPHCNSVSLYFARVWRQHDRVRRWKACEWGSLDHRSNSQKFLSLTNHLASVFSFLRIGVWTGWFGNSFSVLKFNRGERHNLPTLTFRKSFYMPDFLDIIFKWPSVFSSATWYSSNTHSKLQSSTFVSILFNSYWKFPDICVTALRISLEFFTQQTSFPCHWIFWWF